MSSSKRQKLVLRLVSKEVPTPPRSNKHPNPEIAGYQKRRQSQNDLRTSGCSQRVLEEIGPYVAGDVYYYFVENLEADRRFIDTQLARTTFVDELAAREDISTAQKIAIMERYRDKKLCEVLTRMLQKYKLVGTNERVDDFFRRYVNTALREYMDRQLQSELQPPQPEEDDVTTTEELE